MKPWEEIIANIWTWLTTGWKKYVTIPIFVIGFSIPIIFNDSYRSFYFFVYNIFDTKESYPTKDEENIFNEWVVLVSTLNDKTETETKYKEFKEIYAKSGHDVWQNDIFLVRNAVQENEWQIIIDTYPGASTKEDVQGGIENMWSYCEKSRDIENTLGHWLHGARPLFYDSLTFIKTYGQIVKPEIRKNSR